MEQPLTMTDAEQVIRRIAQLPEGVGFRGHCLTRMRQRGFDALDVVRILKNAVMVGQAYKRAGEWRYRVVERPGNAPPDRRGVNVVVVILCEDRLQAHTLYRKR